MVKKYNKACSQSRKISSYFVRLPVTKRREYFVRTPRCDNKPQTLTSEYKGKLPKPTQRNKHTGICQLHYVLGWEPDYAYVIQDIRQREQQVITRILLTSEASADYRMKLLYTYAAYLIDKKKETVFCYATTDITLNTVCDNVVIQYNLCYACLNHVVGTLGMFQFCK